MSARPTLCAVGLGLCERIAVREILRSETEMGFESYESFPDIEGGADRYEAYAVSSGEFVGNLDFFMPRKGRTVVFDSSARDRNPGRRAVAEKDGGGDADREVALPYVLGPGSDELEMRDILRRLASVRDADTQGNALSAREIQVLRQLASGLTTKEIADALCISANTVITHRKNISAKLGIRSVSGLSLYAMMNGLL